MTSNVNANNTDNKNKKLLSWIIWLVIVVAISLGIFFFTTNFIVKWPIQGSSMLPTIEGGDSVLLFKKTNPDYGDVVIFYSKDLNEYCIKRVIGKEGDVIQTVYDEENNCFHLYRNSELVSEETIYEPMLGTGSWRETEVIVPKGKYYVLGDNRNHSSDSHIGYYADKDSIEGVVFLRISQNKSFKFIN